MTESALRRIGQEIVRLADEIENNGDLPDEFTAHVIAARLDEQADQFRKAIHCLQQEKAA